MANEKFTTGRPVVVSALDGAVRTPGNSRVRMDGFSTMEGASSKMKGPWKLLAYAAQSATTSTTIGAPIRVHEGTDAASTVRTRAFFTGPGVTLARSRRQGRARTVTIRPI